MKKAIVFLLLAAMLVSSMTACSETPSESPAADNITSAAEDPAPADKEIPSPRSSIPSGLSKTTWYVSFAGRCLSLNKQRTTKAETHGFRFCFINCRRKKFILSKESPSVVMQPMVILYSSSKSDNTWIYVQIGSLKRKFTALERKCSIPLIVRSNICGYLQEAWRAPERCFVILASGAVCSISNRLKVHRWEQQPKSSAPPPSIPFDCR